MNAQNMIKPAAIGGILLGVLSSLPMLECGCCVWIVGGGVLAAYLYVKESATVVNLGQGVLLGLLAGIIGTCVFALFQIRLLMLSPEAGLELAEQLEQMMERFGFPTEGRDAFRELASRENFPVIIYISTVITQLIANCLLAVLGGALGVAIFEKRKPVGPSTDLPKDEPPSSLPPPPYSGS